MNKSLLDPTQLLVDEWTDPRFIEGCKRHNRRVYSRKYYARYRQLTLTLLGGECVRCGYTGPALQVDHVHGGGNAHRREIAPHSGSPCSQVMHTQIKENPENFQLLCANCNWEKRYENKEWAV